MVIIDVVMVVVFGGVVAAGNAVVNGTIRSGWESASAVTSILSLAALTASNVALLGDIITQRIAGAHLSGLITVALLIAAQALFSYYCGNAAVRRLNRYGMAAGLVFLAMLSLYL